MTGAEPGARHRVDQGGEAAGVPPERYLSRVSAGEARVAVARHQQEREPVLLPPQGAHSSRPHVTRVKVVENIFVLARIHSTGKLRFHPDISKNNVKLSGYV